MHTHTIIHKHTHTQSYTSTHKYTQTDKQVWRNSSADTYTRPADMHTCTNVHKCAQTVADIQRKHTDAKTQTNTAVPISFPISSLLQFAFIFLQPKSGAAAPCTLLDTSNFLKQPTSFPTQHASLNSFYTEDPCNFALRTSGV